MHTLAFRCVVTSVPPAAPERDRPFPLKRTAATTLPDRGFPFALSAPPKLGRRALGRNKQHHTITITMVRTAALALSGAALVATASSFVVPSLLASSRPMGGLSSSSSVHASKLSPDVSSRSRRRREGLRMQSTEGGGASGEAGGGERYYGPTSKPLLDSVQSPADMKRFTLAELKQLAYELRWETLEVRERESERLSSSQKERSPEPAQRARVCAENCNFASVAYPPPPSGT